MELNIDIESVVAGAVSEALAPDRLQPIIAAQVQNAVDRAIEGQFSYRTPFRDLLEKKMAEAMPTDLENMGRMANLVLKTVQEQLLQTKNDFIKQAIEGRLQQMLKPLPPVMKLSELVQQFTEHFSDSHKRDGGDQPTFIVERHDSGYWYLYADPRSNLSAYSCRIRMRFKEADSTGGSECWGCEINESDLSSQKFIGQILNDEALAFNLYTGQVRVILDQDDFSDVYYGHANDD